MFGSGQKLSEEQQAMVDAAKDGAHIVVNATVGSGKTTAIQDACVERFMDGENILYLTFSRLLRNDATAKLSGIADVHSYHSFVYKYNKRMGLNPSMEEAIPTFNKNWDQHKDSLPVYDMIVVDEYQDMNAAYAQLVKNIMSTNPDMTCVFVGDPEQKIFNNTDINIVAVLDEMLTDPIYMAFTQSFRMGKDMAKKLSQAWAKPIIGANAQQEVIHMSFHEALEAMTQIEPEDLLVLGKKSGQVADILNMLEHHVPQKFNKNTVYASIGDYDSQAKRLAEGKAIFCSYDSAKGMEKDTVFVFDFDEPYFALRASKPGARQEIIRNLFLVAASRGKNRIIFVSPRSQRIIAEPNDATIGAIELDTFTELGEDALPDYKGEILTGGEIFGYKRTEDVLRCLENISIEVINEGGSPVPYDGMDGLINLNQAIETYTFSQFFDNFSPWAIAGATKMRQLRGDKSYIILPLYERLHGLYLSYDGKKRDWFASLACEALSTTHQRYVDQVDHSNIPSGNTRLLTNLSHMFNPDDPHQIPVRSNCIVTNGDVTSSFTYEGSITAAHEDENGQLIPYAVTINEDFSSVQILTAAMDMVIAGKTSIRLYSMTTNRMIEVTVPDTTAFLDSAALCMSQGGYDTLMVN